ncbi:ribulose-phosphate 3-epimerase [Terriglobus saanensis]|uniref:Ribulose-phosphate 3-epimerase n=1 Tax=Terriglobus saanensis (strain ATCC BAA-1853 / DSM 23119 / SP1PR4) TaxID=401053 RepID=E8V3V1_TERSS|nr:ribulose-phosphate 3-epimerase [Terriglobus saanensis]ADV81365.1 ribulose-phosphate 3-epimerase [Terriglobus saanensis SP1PR4]
MIELAFSILAADFGHLADEIALAERGGGTVCHIDVMDGHFVPNITFGPPVVAAVRKITALPLDCHLMIEDPDRYIPAFATAGANWVSVQQEVCRHLHRTIMLITEHGMEAGVVINPATPVETIVEVLPLLHHVLVMTVNPGFGGQSFIPRCVEKVAHLADLRQKMGLNFRIEVDGGVADSTVASVVEAGAELLVAGSAIFQENKTEQNAREFLRLARAAGAV